MIPRLLAAVLATVLALAAVPIARAQVVTPNPAPTIITTAPYTITKPGFYQLGANLTYAGNGSANDAIITVAISNVTLDFAGHYISGPSTNSATQLYGVYANEAGNLNIQNGTIAFCYIGALFTGNGTATSLNINQRVTNMLISYCYYEGLDLENVRNSDLANNRISLIGGQIAGDTWGIFAMGSGIRIFGNVVVSISAIGGAGSLGIEVDPPASGGGLGGFVFNNQISNCDYGITGSKYQQNLTDNVTVPFSGGTDAGSND